MHINHWIKTGLLVLIALAAGCASPASIKSWQHNVESYVAENNHDPAVLRDVTINHDRHGFGVIGNADPAKSTDATAVLVGYQPIANAQWFIYLLGLVKDQKVEDIRVAAVSFQNNQATWHIGNKDAKAVATYRQYNESQWRQIHPKEKVPPSYTTFPRDADNFDLNVQGTRITVTHQPSRASWNVDLAAAPKR